MKGIILSIIAVGVIIATALTFSGGSGDKGQGAVAATDNISVVDGKQIIQIEARGGYYPGVTQAKAGMPTILRFKTNGTYDCSSALSVPSLGIRSRLPASGYTDFDVPAQESGAKILGTCSMGMYRFEVDFTG